MRKPEGWNRRTSSLYGGEDRTSAVADPPQNPRSDENCGAPPVIAVALDARPGPANENSVAERKSIFSTGAASGIGYTTAQWFAERYWFVNLFDINQEGLDETAAPLLKGQHISMMFDVHDRAGWRARWRHSPK